MAASRSILESLLARVQRRANEPRQSAVVIPPLPVPRLDVPPDALDTIAPPHGTLDEDIEEYDEELIEIIDDADLISPAAAAARAIDLGAPANGVVRRGPAVGARAVPNGRGSAPAPAAVNGLRPEAVSSRPVAATAVAVVQGARRELRAAPFLELLDASLKLGS